MTNYGTLRCNRDARREKWAKDLSLAATVADRVIAGLRKVLGPMPDEALTRVPATREDVSTPFREREGDQIGNAWIEHGSGRYWFKIRIALDEQDKLDFVLGLLPMEAPNALGGAYWHLLSTTGKEFRFKQSTMEPLIEDLVAHVADGFEQLFAYRYDVVRETVSR